MFRDCVLSSFLMGSTFLLGCAANPPPAPVEPVASPGPEAGVPTSAEPEPTVAPAAEPPPPYDPELKSDLIIEQQLGTAPLVGGKGKYIVGASACTAASRHVILRIERTGEDARQADLGELGCAVKKTGRGGTEFTGETADGPVRYQVRSLRLDATTTGLIVEIQLMGEAAYHWSAVLLSRPGSLRESWGNLTGRTSGPPVAEQLVIKPKGELWHESSYQFARGDHYGVEVLALDAEGEVTGTPLPISLARVAAYTRKVDESEDVQEVLVKKCPALAGRLRIFEVSGANGEPERWLGVPSVVETEAQQAVRELKGCGARAPTLTTLPAN